MMDWVIEELRYKAKIFRQTGAVAVFGGDVVKSDLAVPELVRLALKTTAARLEDIPEDKKDYHPGSNKQVLDLVHPSLFPLVYGRSRILRDSILGIDDGIANCGKGDVLPVRPEEEAFLDGRSLTGWRAISKHYSRKFQWLPCDVTLTPPNPVPDLVSKSVAAARKNDSNVHCTITSYINNLHPEKNKDLYGVVEQIIAKAIPLWNMTLTPVKSGSRYCRIQYTACEYDPDPYDIPEDQQPQQMTDEDEDDFWERREEWEQSIRRVVQPEPGKFEPPSASFHLGDEDAEADRKRVRPKMSVDLFRDYGSTGLQVIVKLANIHLTPDDPEYGGGAWHVEGQMVYPYRMTRQTSLVSH
jgi:hypothetical protein